jgi:hypothetical protein
MMSFMELLDAMAEEEFVVFFLATEITSPRWGGQIEQLLRRDGRGREIITDPDVHRAGDNRYRLRLFNEFRGYADRTRLFGGFPRDVRWHRALITREELQKVKYIRWDYWTDITNGTRLPRDAVERLKAGGMQTGDAQYIRSISETIRNRAAIPEPILVATDQHSPPVVLEGHARVTAYFIDPRYIPGKLKVIVGLSEHMAEWSEY